MPIARQNMKDWGAQCRIFVDGVRLPPNIMRLMKSVQVVHERGKATTLSLEFVDWDYELQNKWIKPNSTIIVTCGWAHELASKGPFKITEYAPAYPESSSPTLSIQGASAAATKMNLTYRTQSYNGKTAKEVFEEVAQRYGLTLEWIVEDDANIQFTDDHSLTSASETDRQLLTRVASKMSGYVWGTEGGVLFVQPPEHATEVVQLNYRVKDKTIMSFTPEIKVFVNGGKKKGKKTAAGLDMFDADKGLFEQLTDVALQEEGYAEEDGQTEDNKPLESDGLLSQVGKLLQSFAPTIEKEQDGPKIRDRFGTPTTENYVSLERVGGRVWQMPYIKVNQKVEGNATEATAVTEDALQRQLTKSARKTVVAGGTLVPTFPSWQWTAREAVFLGGLSTLTSSRFEVAKATLTYDNSKGLQTTLELKSHMPKSDDVKKKDIDDALDQVDNAVRPIQKQRTSQVTLDTNRGGVKKSETPFNNESPENIKFNKFLMEEVFGTNSSRVRSR